MHVDDTPRLIVLYDSHYCTVPVLRYAKYAYKLSNFQGVLRYLSRLGDEKANLLDELSYLKSKGPVQSAVMDLENGTARVWHNAIYKLGAQVIFLIECEPIRICSKGAIY